MELKAKPAKKLTTVGIIVNITKPFKTANAEDYVTKLKVIDQSLNCNTLLERKEGEKELRKYLHVFIYTKTLELAPSIKCIGDIIYLKRYDVIPPYTSLVLHLLFHGQGGGGTQVSQQTVLQQVLHLQRLHGQSADRSGRHAEVFGGGLRAQ